MRGASARPVARGARLRSWLCGAAVLAAVLAPQQRGAAAEFFAGKTINLYIGQGPGGGYDLYGRLAARHLGRHLPGNPQVVPQNMPGAGGLKVANYVYHVATQDGTTLALAAEAVALEQALEGPGIDYEAGRLTWIGRLASSASIFFTWHTSPVKTIADARRVQSAFGSTGIAGITGYTPRALNRLAGTRFKVITGYSGSTDVLLAMERGEVDGGFALWPEFKQQRPDWLREAKINPLYLVAAARAPDLPEVPITEELGESAEGRKVLRLLASTSEIGRALFSTPNVPPDRAAQLRQAFAEMDADPVFKEDAEKSGLRIDPLPGAALQTSVEAVIAAPKVLLQAAKAARE